MKAKERNEGEERRGRKEKEDLTLCRMHITTSPHSTTIPHCKSSNRMIISLYFSFPLVIYMIF